MKKRRTITARLARDIIIRQIAEGNFVRNDASARIACPLCDRPISTCGKTVWEHMTPFALGGADDETNIRLVHAHCADVKTRGSGATTYGSDIGNITKTKRLEKARTALADTLQSAAKAVRPKKTWRSRPIPQRADPWGKEWKKKQKEQEDA